MKTYLFKPNMTFRTVTPSSAPHKSDPAVEVIVSKWPVKVKHRNKVWAKIYQPCHGRESYRVAWHAAGKRQMKSFPTYAGPGGGR